MDQIMQMMQGGGGMSGMGRKAAAVQRPEPENFIEFAKLVVLDNATVSNGIRISLFLGGIALCRYVGELLVVPSAPVHL
jgi:hypothetical protein